MSDGTRSAAVLSVQGLSVRRGETRAVEEASFTVAARALFVLVGPSGCGKTSLLRAIAGFEACEAGTITLDGRRLVGGGRWIPPERREVGMVFQDGALFPHLSVRRNVLYGVERLADAADRAQQALDLVGLGKLAKRYPDELSGGEQQRVALARALAPSPRLLLLDEPFANLDAGLRRRVREEVVGILAEAQTTAILVTHDQEEALSLADEMAVMESGRILQVGAPEEVYLRPDSRQVASFLGSGQLVACRVESGRARLALGELAAEGEDGPGWVVVRPEQLRLTQGLEAGLPGVVLERRFFGHDLVEVVGLESGERLEVRLVPGSDAPVGAKVRLALGPGPFHVLPRRPCP